MNKANKKPANLFIDVAKNGAKQTSTQAPDLVVTDEAYMPRDHATPSKYAEFFEGVQKNKRIKCAPERVSTVSHAFRRWLNQHVCEDAIVRTRTTCPDGMGGIWWLGEREDKPASKPAPTTPPASSKVWDALK